MIVDLNNSDMEIVKEIIVPDFIHKEVIKAQLKTAVAQREYCHDYLFIHFDVDHTLPPYPISLRVPVSMQYYFSKSDPIDFLLHIVDGYVSLLEIMDVAGGGLNFNKKDVRKVSYTYKTNEGKDAEIEFKL